MGNKRSLSALCRASANKRKPTVRFTEEPTNATTIVMQEDMLGCGLQQKRLTNKAQNTDDEANSDITKEDMHVIDGDFQPPLDTEFSESATDESTEPESKDEKPQPVQSVKKSRGRPPSAKIPERVKGTHQIYIKLDGIAY
ncbi:hypothetical protein K439DRAFT_1619844 [Ramaria rubella]|nr:hypothetical protein K439DRAFT_1619844 [Ramaria rubella]